MPFILLGLFLSTLLAALIASWLGRRLVRQSGLPLHSRLVYSDTGAWKKVEKPLFSRHHLLTGKPDYIVELDGEHIPIEVKPNRVAKEPRISDAMQLAAYGLLIEEKYGSSPPYGLMKYRDTMFRVDFTTYLRQELLEVLEEMRRDQGAGDVHRSHIDPGRCLGCGFRSECGEALD